MKSNQKSTKNTASAKQKVPAAQGTRLMSSATQFRTKQVRDPKKYPGSIAITGHEYLGAISTAAATTGSLLTPALGLNPKALEGTRLEKYAELYDKYVFRKFVLHYTSADPSTATGQYIIAYDRDWADTTPSADSEGIRQFFAMSGSQISNVYLSSSFRCPLADPQDFYYTNYTGWEGRLVYQGQIYMAAVSGTTFHGSLWIEYECEFFDPQLDETSPAGLFDKGAAYAISGDTESAFDAFNYLAGAQNVGPDSKTMFKVQVSGNSFEVPQVKEGYYGIILPPGTYLFENRFALKTDSTGEGIANYTILPCRWDSHAQHTGHPDVVSPDVDVTILENSGIGIADTNSSAALRFILSIPATAGFIWLFLTGLTTAPSTTVTYADAILSIIIARMNQISSTMSIDESKPKRLHQQANNSGFFVEDAFPAWAARAAKQKPHDIQSKDVEDFVRLQKLLKSAKEEEKGSQSPSTIKKA